MPRFQAVAAAVFPRMRGDRSGRMRSPFQILRERNAPISFFLVFIGAWVWEINQLWGDWWSNPQYGYGMFVPALCVWLLWDRRAEIAGVFSVTTVAAPPRCFSWGYLVLCLAAALLLPLELLRQMAPRLRVIGILGACFCVGLTAWTLCRLGARRMPGVVAGACLLFLTSVPWPTTLELAITQSLMKGIAEIAATFLNMIGILARARGNLIELATGLVSIDEACSGVRSLQSCLMASVALGQFFRLRVGRAVFLIGLGVGLALLGNLLRTLGLTFIAATAGPGRIAAFHDPAGLTILVGTCAILYWAAGRLETASPARSDAAFPSIGWQRLPRVRVVALLAAASLLAAPAWYAIHEASPSDRAEPLLSVRRDSQLKIEEIPVPKDILEVLRPQRGGYYRGHAPPWGGIAIYTFFWSSGSSDLIPAVHRPDVCMLGVGWKLSGDVEKITVNLDGMDTVWHVFPFQREGEKVIQAWTVWRGGTEQKLNFSRYWSRSLTQYADYFQFIRHGRRGATTEIASVLLDGRWADRESLRVVIHQVFVFRKESGL